MLIIASHASLHLFWAHLDQSVVPGRHLADVLKDLHKLQHGMTCGKLATSVQFQRFGVLKVRRTVPCSEQQQEPDPEVNNLVFCLTKAGASCISSKKTVPASKELV